MFGNSQINVMILFIKLLAVSIADASISAPQALTFAIVSVSHVLILPGNSEKNVTTWSTRFFTVPGMDLKKSAIAEPRFLKKSTICVQ